MPVSQHQLQKLFAPVARFFGRYRTVLFIVLLLSALIITVLTTNRILSQTEDSAYRQAAEANAPSIDFNQDTIRRINQLNQRQDNAALQIPPGRINPFVEQ